MYTLDTISDDLASPKDPVQNESIFIDARAYNLAQLSFRKMIKRGVCTTARAIDPRACRFISENRVGRPERLSKDVA